MTVNISSWLGTVSALTATPTATEPQRAALAWRRINDKPSSLAFKNTAGTVIAAQTVRVESDSTASPAESAAGAAPRRKVIVFGIKGHSTLADTDMKEGYRCVIGNDEYRCTDIIDTLGERQGVFEATG